MNKIFLDEKKMFSQLIDFKWRRFLSVSQPMFSKGKKFTDVEEKFRDRFFYFILNKKFPTSKSKIPVSANSCFIPKIFR